ncbi:HAD-IB family phosphatase [Rheinheimera soli]|uniref:Phosphatidylglycerophosphatase C n=1 Tax=Rheinheimera soli TaxID=443616 RepID=A0ABU1VVT7_9GAMM|nr:HAD-IB family phosphatase [Rheinheimera soli]MDR7119498.1 phosphatidylglycerophosphatase C [Rheinheimera soli]
MAALCLIEEESIIVNLVLFDFDKTIISRDTGAEYMKFMLARNPLRLTACLFACPFVLPFLLFDKAKFVGYSVWLWLATIGMPIKKVIKLRNKFITQYLESEKTVVYQQAVETLNAHIQKLDKVVIVSGASEWMVKKVFAQLALPKVEFACSQEARLVGGMVSSFHCYAKNKVKSIHQRLNLVKYQSIIGYSDSSVDIPILALCTHRFIVNPKQSCLKKLIKSFDQSVTVVTWA